MKTGRTANILSIQTVSASMVFASVISAILISAPAMASPAYETTAPIAYMVDMSSGAVLYDKQSTAQIPPASMAKMLTTYVVFEMLTNGKLQENQKLTVKPETWKAWNNQGSTMFLAPNEQVSVENLLHGLVTLSGNDAAIVLAEGISGSETEFVTVMNKTARRLGMLDSRFGTANGWPDEGRTLTTARDLATLASRTINDYPQLYAKFYGKKEFKWGGVTQPDRNPLLGKVAGADGLKTGHTHEAGYCFTGTAVQGGRRILMVVAGLPSFNSRITESTSFMNWGFSAWKSRSLFKAGSIVATAPMQLGNASSVGLAAPRNLAISYPAGASDKFTVVVRYKGPIKAPVKKGDIIADMVVKLADGTEQISPLIANANVAEAGFFGRVWNGIKSILGI
jgi:serine-type D-Ala-D-Ala carboxypeptidase (penicillin-binding protein 5/6)